MHRARSAACGTALGAAGSVSVLEPRAAWATPRAVPPNDTVRFASNGTGVRGCEIMHAALGCPGTEIVAGCDLCDACLIAAQEVAEKQLPTTKDYRSIPDRKDEARGSCSDRRI